ncbi:hypothetical protein B0A55_07142 [Friedmanniomyces simplex]|uniref:Uncharacterized protein n=1 Tax=Friedmanniomyces simplex TaxID=329884 RepID=A0A4U0X5H8_9PEZI|nr:hypothetical protein B0A55_07142 [Friedmanniomyces simplex]
MKTDNYLTLCLEQAAKLPLHYRHGCIVVRGGKVIGQGYNDYRPGYDGGALKHGRVANRGLDGPAIAELKEKMKEQKDKPKQQQQLQMQPGNTFVPFEATGGGHQANVSLSMHSEMMAIHSALAASATLSSTALASEKPCFKLPRSDKRKARLRAEVLKRYVEAVCGGPAEAGTAMQGAGKLQRCEEEMDWDDEEEQREERELMALRRHAQQSGVQHVVKECRRAYRVPLSGEKHHHHQKRKGNDGKKARESGNENERQYDRDGQQTPQGHGRQQREASASKQRKDEDVARRHDSTVHAVMTEMSRQACADALSHEKTKRDYTRSGKMETPDISKAPQLEPMLLPKGHTGPGTNERKKHPRLVGADLYVARLGWCKAGGGEKGRLPTVPAKAPRENVRLLTDDGGESSLESSIESLSITTSTTTTGSLHDELANREPSPRRAALAPATLDRKTIRASRPCYRCITHMHTAGIKRVFWTNDAGEWEGGKVRDLVDALDDSMESVAKGAGGGPTGNGMFVTKHEVLMLKRL